MFKINYYNWLNGNDCCKQHSDCDCDHQECDCENILLEISKLHIDDNLIKDDLYDLSGKTTSGITITVDPTLDSGSTNPVENSAITVAINSKADKSEIPTVPTSNSAFTNDMGYITNDDLEDYPTTADLDNALSGKQDTLIAGTNIIISGNVISAQGGGSIDIDPSLESGSTNAVANSAITVALNGKADKSEIPTVPTNVSAFNNDAGYVTSGYVNSVVTNVNNALTAHTADSTVHVTQTEKNTWNNKVDSSTLNNYLLKSKIWCGYQWEYDSIVNKDSETLYLIHS